MSINFSVPIACDFFPLSFLKKNFSNRSKLTYCTMNHVKKIVKKATGGKSDKGKKPEPAPEPEPNPEPAFVRKRLGAYLDPTPFLGWCKTPDRLLPADLVATRAKNEGKVKFEYEFRKLDAAGRPKWYKIEVDYPIDDEDYLPAPGPAEWDNVSRFERIEKANQARGWKGPTRLPTLEELEDAGFGMNIEAKIGIYPTPDTLLPEKTRMRRRETRKIIKLHSEYHYTSPYDAHGPPKRVDYPIDLDEYKPLNERAKGDRQNFLSEIEKAPQNEKKTYKVPTWEALMAHGFPEEGTSEGIETANLANLSGHAAY